MALGNNLVKKPKNDDDEIKDEDEIDAEEEIEEKKSSSDDFARKRMIKFMLIIAGGMLFLLLILYIISTLSTRTYSYSDVEQILKTSAQSYFKDHPESLPKEDGSVVEIDASNLVAEGRMKPLSDYTGEVLCIFGIRKSYVLKDMIDNDIVIKIINN